MCKELVVESTTFISLFVYVFSYETVDTIWVGATDIRHILGTAARNQIGRM